MKKVSFLSILVVITSLLMTWGCEDDTESGDYCSLFDDVPSCPSFSFTACSDDDGNDYYLIDGDTVKYYCSVYDKETDTVTCQSTVDTLVSLSGCAEAMDFADDISLKSARISYASFLLDAMDEVRAEARAAAGCE